METTLKGTMRAMHTATGSPFPLFSVSFPVSWPVGIQFRTTRFYKQVVKLRTVAASHSKQHMRFRDKAVRKESRKRKSNNFSSLLYTQQQLRCVYFGLMDNVFFVLY